MKNYLKLIEEKDGIIVEKTTANNGLQQTLRKMTIERTDINRKLSEFENLKKTIVENNTEISNLNIVIQTKDFMLALEKEKVSNALKQIDQELEEEITIEAEIKKCKKCKFTSLTMNVLELHVENDHGYDFQCVECGGSFLLRTN